MPTPQELLSEAAKYFLQRALPEATGRTFAQLSSPSVHLGSYVRYEGGPVTTPLNQQITPRYCLRVSPAVPVQGGMPNLTGTAVPGSGPVTHLLWTRQVADPATDDEAEIRRVMADLDSVAQLVGSSAPAQGNGSAAAPDGSAPAAQPPGLAAAALRSADWARAVVASRSALAVNLSAMTAVPEPLRGLVDDVPGMTQVLRHFFTYDDAGTYYKRWAGAGRDPAKADHLTAEYKQHNVREVVLGRDRLYLYAVVPEGLLAGGGDLGGRFREVVFRLDETLDPERPFTIATVHTASWRRNNAAYEDFVFFYAEDGAGPPIPREARRKMSARLVEFLTGLAAAGADRDAFLDKAQLVMRVDGTHLVHLVARVDEDATLPDYVVSEIDAGAVDRAIQCPPDKISDLALLPAVKHLSRVNPGVASLAAAKQMIHHDALVAKIAAVKRGGKGVVVGIIDSGIDGNHPAFAGRLHAFWDQGNPPVVAGKSPKDNHPGNAAYEAFNTGVELTGADVSKAEDRHGHGTHVAAIAAGGEVKDPASGAVLVSAGLAPQATIVAVRGIGVGEVQDGDKANWISAASYIFQKAAELKMPCVINMSFGGQHFHGHDGSDASSLALYEVLTNRGAYRPGRVVVAAAGNDRGQSAHVRATLPARSGFVTVATLNIPAGVVKEFVTVWIRNPTDTCPVAFPLDLVVRRVTAPLPNADFTKAIRVGQAPGDHLAGLFLSQRTVIGVFSEASNVINGDHNYQLLFQTTDPEPDPKKVQPMAAARWAIDMVNGDSHPLEVHLWVTRSPKNQAKFVGGSPDDETYLVSSPAASAAAIAVGSINSAVTWTSTVGQRTLTPPPPIPLPPVGELSHFSSPGPLRESSIRRDRFYKHPPTHEINGVDCTAPGCVIQSALSSNIAPVPPELPEMKVNARAMIDAGTSMASPVVAGLVANLLAEEPTLTLPQALERLKNASSIPASSKFQPPAGTPGPKPLSRDWGYGLVDAAKLKP
jgi:subtilisin family serine protease